MLLVVEETAETGNRKRYLSRIEGQLISLSAVCKSMPVLHITYHNMVKLSYFRQPPHWCLGET